MRRVTKCRLYFLFLKTIIKFRNHTQFKRKMPNFVAANFSTWAQNQVFSHAYIVNGFKKFNKLVK